MHRTILNEWLSSPHRAELVSTIILALAVVAALRKGRSGQDRGNTRLGDRRATGRVDADMFVSWVEALEDDAHAGLLTVEPGVPCQPDPETLPGFLFERFRPEFLLAIQAWLDTRPPANPAPPETHR